ncbi:MAG: hypothetical protein EI684_02805 [Candidatus Viridilinea halotolerans]|uniref:Uncharacterized protein n=1 Tax=Candidatus Viridilinea halotolerans TaxID=2491704 RepID=A0A426U8F1_9CHLR|nr:MAG: hypothetical protein EI684_02805 [Candidatus Viridilinea halotolerans]
MPKIPRTTPADLRAAMERFDRELRGRGRFARWPTQADRFALAHDGRYYPPKIIISLAAGVGVHTFSGGAESTRYTDQRGLVTVPLDAALRAQLRAVQSAPLPEVAPNLDQKGGGDAE